jgi:hypothetical protein
VRSERVLHRRIQLAERGAAVRAINGRIITLICEASME